ncbi:NAD(P)/FAD-dependent oxidoreductase [Alkalibacter rhizosphaerae]|uniref:NAD(P)/FAD-dependent oxidoreductase n=1 Tax=Alkalibacter rhizosphaerae TaxID=2815577 RepID=A0A975AIB5_9FIRM|nr:NAD(P)/FAD-dependent oxidoreductase [Alkalibacter rhizosphaerae]QSX08903.1 NAD(P)/FAD-dependent oxidoreductase [Alkalibacter rhizosphaerae]
MSEVIVVGGGPAGMMCAGIAASQGIRVTLVEQNEKLGKKLFITGKGRCNFTNACEIEDFFSNIVTNKRFLYSALYGFTNMDTIRFFNELGVKEKIERGNRVFPQSDHSSDIIKAMEHFLRKNQVQILLGAKVSKIVTDKGQIKGVELQDGSFLPADKVVLATGGVTYRQTGSTGDGFRFARELGHGVREATGALIPLASGDAFVKELQGLSLKNVNVTLYENGKKRAEEFGEMIFTHFGVSGPAILSLSSLMKDNKKTEIAIDFKPALDAEKLDKRIQRDFEKNSNREFKNSLSDLLPKKLIPIVIERSGIDGEKRVHQISREERLALVGLLKKFTVNIQGKADINLGIITSGGVDPKEIDPSTMESKIVKGLYFAGELIDVDALTGGFNLQIAFSTGYLAGINTAQEK